MESTRAVAIQTATKEQLGLVILVGAFLTGGCDNAQRLYTGQPRPRAEVAIVKTGSGPNFFMVDEVTVRAPSIKEPDLKKKGVELLPGNHTIQVEWLLNVENRASLKGGADLRLVHLKARLDFRVEAGHEYEVALDQEERDKGTGKTFAVLNDATLQKTVARTECTASTLILPYVE